MFKAIIVDDVKIDRMYVESLLKEFFPEIRVVASVDNLKEAVCEIRNHRPCLVLLDIELPDGKGFEIFNYGLDSGVKVIFITAHNAYAIPMYEYNPVSYILKPIKEEEFYRAVKKAIQALSAELIIPEKIPVSKFEDTLLINTRDIYYIESDDIYTLIYTNGPAKLCSCESLKHYEGILPYPHFLRVHNSYLINSQMILSVNKSVTGITLCNKACIPVSQRKRPMVKEYLRSLESFRTKPDILLTSKNITFVRENNSTASH